MSAVGIMFAQTIVPKKCNICGKSLAQCHYKGKHPKPTTGSHRGHDWVDLGLPSGTKWATMNVGASSPSDYGSYFAWGETSPKSSYDWSNLKYHILGDRHENVKFSKYVIDSKYGTIDGKKKLDLYDDVAYINWGNGWRMPSANQIEELVTECVWAWVGNGFKISSKKTGNFIFLPTAGDVHNSSIHRPHGFYWTNSLKGTNSAYSLYFYFYDSQCEAKLWPMFRSNGLSVRPVCQ